MCGDVWMIEDFILALHVFSERATNIYGYHGIPEFCAMSEACNHILLRKIGVFVWRSRSYRGFWAGSACGMDKVLSKDVTDYGVLIYAIGLSSNFVGKGCSILFMWTSRR